MYIKRLLSTLFITSCVFFALQSQDYIYSQFYNAPLQLNPAFAGNTTAAHFNLNYRVQWPSLNTSYKTYSVSYDQFIRKFNSGVGLWMSNDNQGDGIITSIDVKGIYSYKMQFQSGYQLKIGIEAGMKQSRLDWNKLIFYDQIDRRDGPNPGGSTIPSADVQPDNLSRAVLDVATGILLYNPKYYIGLTAKHLTSPYIGFGTENISERKGIPLLLSLHAGYQIVLDEGNKRIKPSFISPNVLFAKQGSLNQINFGTYLQIQSVFGGIWMRHTFGNIDALIFSFGVDAGNFKIAYSFDLTSSSLGLSTGGSHELGLSMRIGVKEPSKLNDCLKLFH